MAQLARLFYRAIRSADEVLLLTLDPEVRGKIGDVGKDRDEWNSGYRFPHALPNRAIQVRHQRDDQVRVALGPQLPEQADLLRVQKPDQELHSAGQLRGAQCPALVENQVVAILKANAEELAEEIELVERLLQIHQADFPWPPLLLDRLLQSVGGAAMAAAGIE